MSGGVALRAVAFALAIAGVIDPGVTRSRPEAVEVAVIDGGHPQLAAAVRAALNDEYTVVPGPYRAAAVTIVAGDAVPDAARDAAGAGFVVAPAADPGLRITAVRAPGRVPPHVQVPVGISIQTGGSGPVEVTLSQNGLTTDRATIEAADLEGGRATIELGFVPAVEGPSLVRVTARRGEEEAMADTVIDVRPEVRRVLFYDPRPSWASTFIRRALEADPRFDVTSRVMTSGADVSMNVNDAPDGVSNVAGLRSFDVVVAGAPTALTAGDWDGLEAFARRRGGTVIVPIDETPAPATLGRLTGVRAWRDLSAPAPVALQTTEDVGATLAAAELLWPDGLPSMSGPLASLTSAATAEAASAATAPVIWAAPLGAGQIIVSGALDAWRYRARSGGDGFDAFWRRTVAAAAARTLPAVSLEPDALLVSPGERRDVTVLLRDPALEADTATSTTTSAVIAAWLADASGARVAVPLTADGPAGTLRARLAAPAAPGLFTLVVESDGDAAEATVVVGDDLHAASPVAADVAAAWAASRGGRVVPEAELGDLAASIREVVSAPLHEDVWHPMRSGWWILPFGLVVGVEWWWRRRDGLA